MKKTMLWGALFTSICTQVQAEVTQQPTPSLNPAAASAPATPTTPVTQEPVVIQTNPNALPTATQPTNQQPAQQIPTIQLKTAPVINCDYKISAETKTIDQSLVLTWSEKAVTQAFDFDPVNIDSQVLKLKACFTDQGWTGFNTALVKSGNVEAIKTQKLTVSSEIDGQAQVTEAKDNQWKITLPLHVVYQNDKEKVTQLLSINLTISRKMTGELGIVQMIATPRVVATSPQTNNPTDPNTASDTNNPTESSGTADTSATTSNTATPSTPVTTEAPQAPEGNPITQPTDSPTTDTPGAPQ